MKYALLTISIGLYIASLFFNAIGADYFAIDVTKYEIETGVCVLSAGWMGFLVAIIAWYANIFYFIGIVLFFFKKKFAFYLSLIVVIVASTMFYPGYKFTYYLGAYLWFGSMLCFLLACLYACQKSFPLMDLRRRTVFYTAILGHLRLI